MADYSFGFGGNSSSNAGGSYSFGFGPTSQSKSKQLSGRQLLERAAYMKYLQDNPHHSLLHNVLHGTGHGLGWVLDKISRPAYASASAAFEGSKGQGFDLGAAAHGAREGFMGREHKTYSDVIKENFPHFAHQHKVYTALGGLGADILTDPSLPLLVGATAVTGGGASPALAAKIALDTGVELPRVSAVARILGVAKDSRAELKATKKTLEEARKTLESSDAFPAAKALAHSKIQAVNGLIRNGKISTGNRDALQFASAAADAEFKTGVSKAVQLKYHIPFSGGKAIPLTPTEIAGRRVAPLLPSLKRTAEGKGLLSFAPGAVGGAKVLGKVFKPGFEEPLFHATQMMQRRLAEQRTDDVMRYAVAGTKDFRDLSEESKRRAIDYGESHQILYAGAARNINPRLVQDAVAHGHLTEKEAGYLTAFHDVMNQMRRDEKAAGVKYDEEIGPKLYVPHIFTRDGGIITKSRVAQAGFSRARAGDLTIKEIEDQADALKANGLELVSNPDHILAVRSRKSGQEQAKAMWLTHLRSSFGTPVRVIDPVKEAANKAKLADVEKRIDALDLMNQKKVRGRQISIGRQVGINHRKRLKGVDQEFAKRNSAIVTEAADRMNALIVQSTRMTPAWTHFRTWGRKKFAQHISHFNQADAEAAVKLHGHMHTLRGIRRQLIKMGAKPSPKEVRAIAERLAQLEKDVLPIAARTPGINDTLIEAVIATHEGAKIPLADAAKMLGVPDHLVAEYTQRVGKRNMYDNTIPGARQADLTIKAAKAPDGKWVGQLHVKGDARPGWQSKGFKLKKDAEQAAKEQLERHPKKIETKFEGKEAYKPRQKGETWRSKFLYATQAQGTLERELRRQWSDLAAKYPNTKVYSDDAIIKRLEKQTRELKKWRADRYQASAKAAHLERGRMKEALEKEFDKQAARSVRLSKLADAHTARIGTHFKPNPNVPDGWIKKHIPALKEDHFFHPEVERGLSRIERVANNDEEMANLGGAMRKIMAQWKIAVTVVNPGYRVRNTMSDLWNAYIAGVPTARMVQYGTKAAHLQARVARLAKEQAELNARGLKMRALSKKEANALNTYVDMYRHGILSGLFQGDVQQVAGILREGGFQRYTTAKRNPITAYVNMAQVFNRNAENWGRVMHYLYRRDYEKMSAVNAANWVKRAHFDYEDLTPAEQKYFKLVMPFYTWTRKNLPYQLTQIVSRPGKYDTFAKVVRTSNELATGDPNTEATQENFLPTWMQESYGFRVPGGGKSGNFLLPQIGVADLQKIEHPSNLITQMWGPQFKIPFELATGTNTFTGQPIQGTHPRNPVSGFGADVLKLLPGSNVGQTSRNVRGQTVYGQGANPWYLYAAGQIPMLNQLMIRESNIKQAQQGNAWFPRLSYAAGLSIYDRDLESEQTAAQLQWADQFKRIMRGLRDEGAFPETKKRKPSKNQQFVLTQGGG